MSSHHDNPPRRRFVLLHLQLLALRPLSFKSALGLSLVVHVVIFFLMATLFSFVRSSRGGPAPLLLEFAFMPGYDGLKTPAAALSFSAPTAAPASTPTSPQKISQQLGATPSPNETFSALVEEESPASSELASQELPDETLALKSWPTSPRAFSSTPALAPASLPLAHKEQRRLEREMVKLSTKALFFAQKDTSINFKSGDEVFTASVRHNPASTATGIDEAEIIITTEKNGRQWQTSMRMKRLAFSHFAQFVDYWDPHVAVHDDQLDGRFHTNSSFAISSSRGVRPKFQGKVTTAAFEVRQSDAWGAANDKEIFQAGLETGAREIRMPNQREAFFQTKGLADSLYHRMEEEAWLTFHADGSYSWRVATEAEAQRRKLPRQPFLIVGGKKAALHVRGVVAGKVLVQSEKKIVIDDDLTYAHPPEIVYDSEDYLGLVCRKDIVIAPPQMTGPGDLHLSAAILAGGRFEVTHLYRGDKATLHIYGSLSAGSLSATEPRYATHVRFDKRLEQRRPPYFPMTDRYEITDWQPEWKMVMPERERGQEEK